MKIPRYFIMFLFLIIVFSPAIALLDAPDVQAAPLGQSAEDRIQATLEEANQILGGGFEWGIVDEPWTSESVEIYFLVRPSDQGYLLIKSVSESFCLRRGWWDPWTFHGMNGCISGGQGANVENAWEPENTLALDGYPLIFSASSNGGKQGAKVLAEALHQAAVNNGLYWSSDGENLPDNPTDQYTAPPQDYTENQGQELPGDYTETPDSGNPFDIPLAIVLGSLGVPVTGAVIGAVLSAIMSGTAAAGSTTSGVISGQTQPPQIGSEAGEGLVWSERPWDEAGPGYVPKEEYLRTKDFLEKGYKWKDGGWQTPKQIEQIADWDRNNRKAVDKEDANWRAKQDAERQALEENKEVLEKKKIDLQNAENFDLLKDDFNAINQNLEQENIYVVNPYQGDPTVMGYGLNTLKNIVWDKTGGQWTGSQGLTCEGYVKKTSEKVLESVTNRFPGAEVQNVIFEEKSTVKADKTAVEWLDSFIDDNHSLIKIILPDGSEWAVDFHQNNAGNSPLLRPWSEAIRDWKNNYMGDEFRQYTRSKILAKPKSRT